MSRLRRQCYNGASKMRDKFNGVKVLILKENPCTFYIHCFVHPLQLTVVEYSITNIFHVVGDMANTIETYSKLFDLLQEK